MNIEELTLVMDTLRQLGGDGKEAFIWWLMFDKVLPIIAWLTALAILMVPIRWMLASMHGTSYLCSLRDRLDIGSPGHLNMSELTQVQRVVDKALREPGK
jgi:hypothetical protein